MDIFQQSNGRLIDRVQRYRDMTSVMNERGNWVDIHCTVSLLARSWALCAFSQNPIDPEYIPKVFSAEKGHGLGYTRHSSLSARLVSSLLYAIRGTLWLQTTSWNDTMRRAD